VLRSEGERYVQRLRDAGVTVNYRVFAGQMHGFFSLHRVLPGSEVARHWLVEAITDHLSTRLPLSNDRKGNR
jgi:acetyl esterase